MSDERLGGEDFNDAVAAVDLAADAQGRVYTYHAEYKDAEDVRGTVQATGISEAADLAANDMLSQVGANPIDYGKLIKVTVTAAEDDGVTLTIAPEYD